MEKAPVIVTSNVKKTVKAVGGFNTSQGAIDVLNQHVHTMLTVAIEKAKADGRKTVMDRDFDVLIQKGN